MIRDIAHKATIVFAALCCSVSAFAQQTTGITEVLQVTSDYFEGSGVTQSVGSKIVSEEYQALIIKIPTLKESIEHLSISTAENEAALSVLNQQQSSINAELLVYRNSQAALHARISSLQVQIQQAQAAASATPTKSKGAPASPLICNSLRARYPNIALAPASVQASYVAYGCGSISSGADLAALNKQLSDAQAELAAVNAAISNLTTITNNLSGEIAKSTAKLKALSDDLTSKSRDLASSEARFAELDAAGAGNENITHHLEFHATNIEQGETISSIDPVRSVILKNGDNFFALFQAKTGSNKAVVLKKKFKDLIASDGTVKLPAEKILVLFETGAADPEDHNFDLQDQAILIEGVGAQIAH